MKPNITFQNSEARMIRSIVTSDIPELNGYVILVLEPNRALPPDEQFYAEFLTDSDERIFIPGMMHPAYKGEFDSKGTYKADPTQPYTLDEVLESLETTRTKDYTSDGYDYRNTFLWGMIRGFEREKRDDLLKMNLRLEEGRRF